MGIHTSPAAGVFHLLADEIWSFFPVSSGSMQSQYHAPVA